MSETALLAVVLAAVAGLLAGRAWAAAARRGSRKDQPAFRTSPHYTQGLHFLVAGQSELAISELTKVSREDPSALEVLLVLGNLLREKGQVGRAIQVHTSLLGRADLARGERIQVQACLGMDFRKAGFLDRATEAFSQVLQADPKNLHALAGMLKLCEEQRQWREAYELQTRLSRLRNTDDSLVLGFLQAKLGDEAAQLGQTETAERSYRMALSLDSRVFPAHLGLVELCGSRDPVRAASLLEAAIRAVPDRAYLAFDRLAAAYAAAGTPSRFIALCEQTIARDSRDWRARLALARQLRVESRHDEAFGLLVRAVEINSQVLVLHLEIWRTLSDLGAASPNVDRYLKAAEESTFYRDPHICTSCRYRADDMLWRCPHCHEWSTFVEERLAAAEIR